MSQEWSENKLGALFSEDQDYRRAIEVPEPLREIHRQWGDVIIDHLIDQSVQALWQNPENRQEYDNDIESFRKSEELVFALNKPGTQLYFLALQELQRNDLLPVPPKPNSPNYVEAVKSVIGHLETTHGYKHFYNRFIKPHQPKKIV